MAGLPREVIRWLQSLDLTWQIKSAKWDMSNGYLVAEVFSWYFPQAIQMHNFYTNGTSLKTKQLNWDLLNTFIKKNNIDIPPEFTDATMHCKEGAAQLLVERMYEILTNRKVKKKEGFEIDFTDRAYQTRLPLHARTTASQAVKNNVKLTELDAQQSVLHTQYKLVETPSRPTTHDVIRSHVEQRRTDRLQYPDRFDITPSIAEKALRRPPPQSTAYDDSNDHQVSTETRAALVRSGPASGKKLKSTLKTPSTRHEGRNTTSQTQEVNIKEVSVKQMNSPTTNMVAVGGE